jgi:hypothetical protein
VRPAHSDGGDDQTVRKVAAPSAAARLAALRRERFTTLVYDALMSDANVHDVDPITKDGLPATGPDDEAAFRVTTTEGEQFDVEVTVR